MNKLVIASLVIGAIGFTSCGSQSPTEIAEEVCECFDAAGDDEKKREECGKKSMAAMKQFKADDDKEGAKEYMKKFNGGLCE